MDYVIDDKLSGFARLLWRPMQFDHDPNVGSPSISPEGRLRISSYPIEGPECDKERFFTVIWHSAKPSRVPLQVDTECVVKIGPSGKLVGAIGYDFEFVDSPYEADGVKKLFCPWRMF